MSYAPSKRGWIWDQDHFEHLSENTPGVAPTGLRWPIRHPTGNCGPDAAWLPPPTGILVTTWDDGSDAHKFASDKPTTLLSGSHLLHLLEKHGIKAKIDLAAAKRELRARA